MHLYNIKFSNHIVHGMAASGFGSFLFYTNYLQ